MHFINPVEILDMSGAPLTAIDQPAIRKAKKALLAEISLSDDGLLHYKGQQLTAADAEALIDRLEQPDQLEYYHFIANHRPLNEFLSAGDPALFNAFQHEGMYRLPAFIAFISPWFAPAYDRLLLTAYQQEDSAAFKTIAAVMPLVTVADQDLAYKSLRQLLNEQLDQMVHIGRPAHEKQGGVDLQAVTIQLLQLIDLEKVNALPPALQTLRNNLAALLREIYLILFHDYNAIIQVKELLDVAAAITTDGMIHDRIAEELATYDQNPSVRKENDPVFRHYMELFGKMKQLLSAVANPATNVPGIRIWINEHVDIPALNALDASFDAVRENMANGLRDLGALIWNHHGDDIAAISYTYQAEDIRDLKESTLDSISRVRSDIEHAAKVKAEKAAANGDVSIEKQVSRVVLIIVIIIIVYVFMHR